MCLASRLAWRPRRRRMLEFLEGIGSGSVWAFWAPVVVWTGLAGVAAFVLERLRGLHPVAGCRLRQALSLALPMSVLAAPWVPGLFPPDPAFVGLAPSATDASTASSSSGGVAALHPGPFHRVDIALVFLGAATVAVLVLAMARLAILATDLRQLHRLRWAAHQIEDSTARGLLRELAEKIGVRRPVVLFEGPPGGLRLGSCRPCRLVGLRLPSPGVAAQTRDRALPRNHLRRRGGDPRDRGSGTIPRRRNKRCWTS